VRRATARCTRLIDLGQMFLLGTTPGHSRWNVGGRRTMWRMSNGQAVIFIALIVIAVALMLMLLA
jgi:hypothetical protein